MGFVAAVAKLLALVVAVAAAIAAGLIVMPALTMKMALLAIVASEKSALIAAAAVVSLPLAFFGFTRGRRMPSTVAVVLAVAAIGSSRALQYTAIGDAVNTASRLCSAAQAGQVILSEATFRKVQADVAAVPLPPIRVKGKADELRVFNAVGLRNRTFPAENTRPG